MADDDNDIFVYLGGEQEVPMHITHAIIDPSVNTVRRRAFYKRKRLVSVIFHDGIEIIEYQAFKECNLLRGVKLIGVREIGDEAFDDCVALTDVDFGDKLETIGAWAFASCSLRSIKIPSVRNVHSYAFSYNEALMDVEFGIHLERIGFHSFYKCPNLQRIAIPLKDNLFSLDHHYHQYNQFDKCNNFTTVDLVGANGIHNTISSLLMESWRNEMKAEIGRINEELTNAFSVEKANMIQQWIRSVINRMDHYKAEHNSLLKEHMTQLELAVWKAKIEEEEGGDSNVQTKRVKIDEESKREEKRIMSGADIIIKNVLPFLGLR